MDTTEDKNELESTAAAMHHSREMQSEVYQKYSKGALGQDSNFQKNKSNELKAAATAMYHSTEMQLQAYEKY